MGQPLVFPYGVTVYNPEKCWGGYTIVPLTNDGVSLFDMNGNEVRRWNMRAVPPKPLPGGCAMGLSGHRHPDYGMWDGINLIGINYDGNIVWEFDHSENIGDPGRDHRWMARQCHDYQRGGNPVGYYVPGADAKPLSGNTLILVHQTIHNPKTSDKKLLDDAMIEMGQDGNILWKWSISGRFDELGLDETARNVLFHDPSLRASGEGVGDYLCVNCINYLGPNKWYDQGDMRFKPDNIIFDCREASILAILDKETGRIVWRIGPDFNAAPELKRLGWVIRQHHFHMIPKDLPGEGNPMVSDNGGWGGYGAPNPSSLIGIKNALRDYSRVLEFNSVTLEVVWKLTPKELGHTIPTDASKFYSPYVSSAQRLPNGNTLVTEGSDGKLIEVTSNHETIWEWISPYHTYNEKGPRNSMIYGAYRYSHGYAPQEPVPIEVPIERIDSVTHRAPGVGASGAETVIDVEGTLPCYQDAVLCVTTDDEEDLSQRERISEVDTQVFHPAGTASWKDEVLAVEDKPVLVSFGAEHCVHCKALHPVLEGALKEEYGGAYEIRCADVNANQELADTYNVGGIPAVVIFRNRKEVLRFNDETDYDDLCDILDHPLEKV